MRVTNNVFGRIQLTFQHIHRAKWLLETGADDEAILAELGHILGLWKLDELNLMSGWMKDIYNREAPVQIASDPDPK